MAELSTRVDAIAIAGMVTSKQTHRVTSALLPPSPPDEVDIDQALKARPARTLGKDHSRCTLKCGVKRALMMDSRLCGEVCEGARRPWSGEDEADAGAAAVPVRVHMSTGLFEPGFAPRAITIEPTVGTSAATTPFMPLTPLSRQLHVHFCPLTEAQFVVAHELVRQFLPTCPEQIGRSGFKRQHRLLHS